MAFQWLLVRPARPSGLFVLSVPSGPSVRPIRPVRPVPSGPPKKHEIAYKPISLSRFALSKAMSCCPSSHDVAPEFGKASGA